MPSKTPPISLRLSSDLLGLVDACAAHHGLRRHAAIVALVNGTISLRDGVTEVTGHAGITPRQAQRNLNGEARAILDQAEARAAHLASPAPRKRNWSLKGVQFGPNHPEPGSRLKGRGLHPKTK